MLTLAGIMTLLLMAAEPAVPAASTPPAPEVAITIKEKDLIPEGIAWDPKGSTMYVSSLQKNKIVAVAADGAAKDFTTTQQDGLWDVLGLRVDVERRILWAMSAGDMKFKEEKGLSGVFKYDLTTGKLIKKYLPADGKSNHLFNDAALSPRGDLYLTDSLAGSILWIPLDKDELQPFLGPDILRYPNGIAITPDGKTLFVAHETGIAVIDTSTKDLHDIRTQTGVPLLGIDGLYFHKGSLVAIQNGVGPGRVMRFYLSKGWDRVEKAETIDADNPLFHIPTTGALAGDTFYYLANSQLDSFNPSNGRILPPDKLKETWILKVLLR